MDNSSDVLPSQLPNPFTPMAFLAPELAYQTAMTTYIVVGMLGVLVWDVITHSSADYKLLTRYRVNIPTFFYFLSRWCTLLYSVMSVVFETSPVDCAVFSKATCTLYHPTVSTTALLFFFRVRALYNGNRYITAVFFVMWLGVLGASLTVIWTLEGTHIGNTKYCTYVGFRPYGSSSNVAIAIFDTCVFVAISWHLLANAPSAGGRRSSDAGRFGLFGRYLPHFSRALLQDGQKYYLVAMVCNLLVLIMTFVHGIPTIYRTIFLVPSVGLTNIMACRVFRNTKLGHRTEVDTDDISIMFRCAKNTAPVYNIHPGGTGSTTDYVLESSIQPSSNSHTDVESSAIFQDKL